MTLAKRSAPESISANCRTATVRVSFECSGNGSLTFLLFPVTPVSLPSALWLVCLHRTRPSPNGSYAPATNRYPHTTSTASISYVRSGMRGITGLFAFEMDCKQCLFTTSKLTRPLLAWTSQSDTCMTQCVVLGPSDDVERVDHKLARHARIGSLLRAFVVHGILIS